MSKTFRRFEILLPLRFNDGARVPDDLVADTLLELRTQFGDVSCETQTIQGIWQYEGQVFRDDLIRVFVDAGDNIRNRKFLKSLKERLKARFRQLDIWITSHPIDVL